MRILRDPSDEETFEALNKLSAQQIFETISNYPHELDEKWFQLAVNKGLLKGLSPKEILLKAVEGGSLTYLQSAHVQLIKSKDPRIMELFNKAICAASKYGHLQIVKYLTNFGANIEYALMCSNKHPEITDFALKCGARLNHKVLDLSSGETHSILYFMVKDLTKDLVEFVDEQLVMDN